MTSQPPFFAASFAIQNILEALCQLIGEHGVCSRMPRVLWVPFSCLLRVRLRRAALRFYAIVERLRAGTLRPPRRRAPSRGETTEPSEVRPREPDPFPRSYAWLCDLIPDVKTFGYIFASLMRDPDMRELLAAAPQVWRIMRPLLIMTGADRNLMRRRRAPRREPTAAPRPPRVARPPHPLRPPKPVYVITPDMPHHPSQVLARLDGYRPRRSRKKA